MIEEQDIQQIKDIIHDEIQGLFKLDRYYFEKQIELADGRNIQTGLTTGTKIGTTTTQKIGFYNTTPVDQPETVSSPSGGAVIDLAAREAIDAIIARLQELGLIK